MFQLFFENWKEITASTVVVGSFVAILFRMLPQAFQYHERRLQELSCEYRKREEEQESRHRREMKELLDTARLEREESRRLFCESLKELTARVGSIETKIDKLIA